MMLAMNPPSELRISLSTLPEENPSEALELELIEDESVANTTQNKDTIKRDKLSVLETLFSKEETTEPQTQRTIPASKGRDTRTRRSSTRQSWKFTTDWDEMEYNCNFKNSATSSSLAASQSSVYQILDFDWNDLDDLEEEEEGVDASARSGYSSKSGSRSTSTSSVVKTIKRGSLHNALMQDEESFATSLASLYLPAKIKASGSKERLTDSATTAINASK